MYTGAPYEIGYHQMFEELFEALEERLPPRALDYVSDATIPTVPRAKLQMNANYDAFNPHLRHLSVDYKCATLASPACSLCCSFQGPGKAVLEGSPPTQYQAEEANSELSHAAGLMLRLVLDQHLLLLFAMHAG